MLFKIENCVKKKSFGNIICKTLLAVSFSFTASTSNTNLAYGWGVIGHQMIGEVAEQFLTPKTKKEIAKIIGDNSLADISNWADAIKRDQPQTGPWHFIQIENQETPYQPFQPGTAPERGAAGMDGFEAGQDLLALLEEKATVNENLYNKELTTLTENIHNRLAEITNEYQVKRKLIIGKFPYPDLIEAYENSSNNFDQSLKKIADPILFDVYKKSFYQKIVPSLNYLKKSHDSNIASLEYNYKKFKDLIDVKKRDRQYQKEVLMFFVHVISDLHQPLHISLKGDRGGNDYPVRWFSRGTWQQSNLHRFWDDFLIDLDRELVCYKQSGSGSGIGNIINNSNKNLCVAESNKIINEDPIRTNFQKVLKQLTNAKITIERHQKLAELEKTAKIKEEKENADNNSLLRHSEISLTTVKNDNNDQELSLSMISDSSNSSNSSTVQRDNSIPISKIIIKNNRNSKSTNKHCLIIKRNADYKTLLGGFSRPSLEQIENWKKGTILDWIKDIQKNSINSVYDIPKDQIVEKVINGEIVQVHVLDKKYVRASIRLYREKIIQAGIRLAHILNSIFDK